MKKYRRLILMGGLLFLGSCSYKHAYQPIVFSKLDTKENYEALAGRYASGETTSFTPAAQQKTLYQEANAAVAINHVANVRELGGIITQDQRVVQAGRFYRSGHLGKLKKKDFKVLQDYGISQVIDLRTDREIKKHPDRLPTTISYYNLQAFEDSEDMFSKAKKEVLKGRVTVEESNKAVEEFYGIYVLDNPEKIREIVVRILDNEEATLFHCSAGKDRTGMIGAIVLSILNVDRQTIMEEYLLSNNGRVDDVASRMKLAKFGKFMFPKIDYEVIENFSWIKPNYLTAMFTAIEAKYGTMDAYITQGLSITKEQRQQYINKNTTILK
ncbi:tyrosine-protein phosphatase [Myroides sp. DF42-4-2]|uniref:tyrosine-protein phosphatase n=1 Tax=unclassified Myroides TaxID=2642485 RepID=UPI002574A845|nr:tyrosine-protein phosphatase [Myroides sp. DF42-4-2]MDM1406621.1 tyrosine-protein phosphatase [Myroides sp. DF42-4-2]